MAIRNKGFLAGATIGVGLTAAAAIAAGAHFQTASAQGPGFGQGAAGAIQPTAPPGAQAPTGAPASFADIVQRVAPAVVSIEVTTHLKQQQMMTIPGLPFAIPAPGQGQGDNGDDGDDNNGSDNGDQAVPAPSTRGGHAMPKKAVPKGPEAMAAGSGFFISSDGYIVTNNHVIQDAETIKVTLSDQRELTARLVGRDPLSDLAVLKVDGGPFPFVSFETAAKPRVGDWVIAIGNPYTLGGTVTAGIVSAEDRPIGTQFVNYLQIDAPINRGNSGGPTFDVFGRVVGVNTAIFSESGGSVGIGFAIPADLAANVIHQLISTGHVTRGFLGVSIQSLTHDMAASQGLGDRRGAIVGDVTPGGPAAQAGIQVGDIVLSVNGHPVKSSEDLSQVTANIPPGGAIALEIVRGGRHLTINAHSGTRPANLAASPDEENGGAEDNGAPSQAPAGTRVIGMTVAPLTDARRRQLNVPASVHGGVVITRVGSESDAAHIGIHPGYVIQRANDQLINTPADLVAAVAAARHEGRPSILLLIQADGKPAFVPVKLDSDDAQK